MDTITAVADFLRLSGPYGLVAGLAWAFWHATNKKDAELKAAYERVERLATRQTEAFAKVEAAIMALKDALGNLHRVSDAEFVITRTSHSRSFDE